MYRKGFRCRVAAFTRRIRMDVGGKKSIRLRIAAVVIAHQHSYDVH